MAVEQRTAFAMRFCSGCA